MFFHRTPWLVQQLYPSLIWSGPVNDKSIYLTFDDGPIPKLTDFILDTLGQFNVKGTFFCVGENLIRHNEISQRTIEAGHQIGNHTFSHLNGWETSNKDYLDNFGRCSEILKDYKLDKNLFRPPYGKITRAQISKIKSSHKIVMWNVLTGDYSSKIDPGDCLSNSINSTKPGSIVLFHDNIKAEKNLRYTLPRYIEHFLKRDYQFDLI